MQLPQKKDIIHHRLGVTERSMMPAMFVSAQLDKGVPRLISGADKLLIDGQEYPLEAPNGFELIFTLRRQEQFEATDLPEVAIRRDDNTTVSLTGPWNELKVLIFGYKPNDRLRVALQRTGKMLEEDLNKTLDRLSRLKKPWR